jgi:hypothetical protein
MKLLLILAVLEASNIMWTINSADCSVFTQWGQGFVFKSQVEKLNQFHDIHYRGSRRIQESQKKYEQYGTLSNTWVASLHP